MSLHTTTRAPASRPARGLLAAGLAGLLLAGCATGGTPGASGGAGDEPSKDPFSGEVTGEMTVWSWDVAAEAMERLAPAFEEEHPGTTIDVVDIGYDNAYDKMSVGLQAGSGLPDLLTVETQRMPGYIAEFPGSLHDVSTVPGVDPETFDASKVAASSGPDGQLFSIPWDSGTVALYYRSDYLAEAGVDPAGLTTWAATLDAGEKVKAATGHTLMSTDVSTGSVFLTLLQQQGTSIFDENGDIAVNGPEGVRALTLLKDMNDRGLLTNVRGWDRSVSAAKDGTSAVLPEAVWWTGTLTSEMPELAGKYGVAPLPTFDGEGAPTSNNGGSTLAVPTQAKNPALAGAFASFVLADRASQVSMMEDEGLFPALLPALDDPYFKEPQPYFSGQPVYELFAGLTSDIPTISYTGDYATGSDAVANAVVASTLNGKDPKEALDEAAQRVAKSTGRKVAG